MPLHLACNMIQPSMLPESFPLFVSVHVSLWNFENDDDLDTFSIHFCMWPTARHTQRAWECVQGISAATSSAGNIFWTQRNGILIPYSSPFAHTHTYDWTVEQGRMDRQKQRLHEMKVYTC